jgi:hypothetical protein
MANRNLTDPEAAEVARAYFQKRVQELAKSLEELKAQELKKGASIPTHAGHQGTAVGGGTSDIAPGKLDKPGKLDALKSEDLCKECGKAHVEKACKAEDVGKSMLSDSKGKVKDNGIHPESTLPEDKKPKEINKPGKDGKTAGSGGVVVAKSETLGKTAAPPMAKPPSGVNMGTHVPTSAPKAAPKAPAAPAAMKGEPKPETKHPDFASKTGKYATALTGDKKKPSVPDAMAARHLKGEESPEETSGEESKEESSAKEMSKAELVKANPREMNVRAGAQMSRDAHQASKGPAAPAPKLDPSKATQTVLGPTGSSVQPRAAVMQAGLAGAFSPDKAAMAAIGPTPGLAARAPKPAPTMLPSASAAPKKPGIFGRLLGKGEMGAEGNNPVAADMLRSEIKPPSNTEAARAAVKEMKDRGPKIAELEAKAKKLATPSKP